MQPHGKNARYAFENEYEADDGDDNTNDDNLALLLVLENRRFITKMIDIQSSTRTSTTTRTKRNTTTRTIGRTTMRTSVKT
jgi:hypothetical protein